MIVLVHHSSADQWEVDRAHFQDNRACPKSKEWRWHCDPAFDQSLGESRLLSDCALPENKFWLLALFDPWTSRWVSFLKKKDWAGHRTWDSCAKCTHQHMSHERLHRCV